jgi:hypothetical protein
MTTKRQSELPGIERKVIKEIDAAAEAYVVERDKRMRLSKRESDAKQALIRVMKKHKVEAYRDDASTPPLIIFLSTVDNVKVTESELEEKDDDEKDEKKE